MTTLHMPSTCELVALCQLSMVACRQLHPSLQVTLNMPMCS